MQDTILGLDIGTASTKAILFDLAGTELAMADQSYQLHTPQPGWVEQDPEDVWRALVTVLRAIVDQAGADRRILAMAMAAQSGSVIPANADGQPVYPMITWMDGRTDELVKRWQRQGVEEMVRQTSGWLLHPGLPLPTIAWLRQYRPDVFGAAERYLSISDFLVHRLTGRFCIDLSTGAEMLLVDAATGQWSQQLCQLVGINPAQLSALDLSGTIIGPIRAEVSRLTGLSTETLVVNGGHDQCCAALALGMTSAGKLKLACGTAWVITGVTETPSIGTIPANMDLNFHVVPRRWTVSQFLGGFGATVDWWLNQCCQAVDPDTSLTRTELYAHFDKILAQSQPGSNGLLFLPLGGGSQLPASNQQGGFVGLRLDHTRTDMSRAILEGAAFELRWAVENIRQADMPVEQLWMAGGATRSPLWPGILADVVRVPIFSTEYAHLPTVGAAILAGNGVGAFETFEAGVARFKKSDHEIVPNEAFSQLYDERMAVYKRMAQCLAQV